MKNALTDQSFVSIGILALIVGLAWNLSSRLTAIEERVQAIPKIEEKVSDLSSQASKADTAFQLLKQQVGELKHPLENTQANVRVLIKQGKRQNAGRTVASPFNRGPFGVR